MKQLIKAIWRNFLPAKIRVRIKDFVEEDAPPYLKETHSSYIDALKESCQKSDKLNDVNNFRTATPLIQSFNKYQVDHTVFSEKFWTDFVTVASKFDENCQELQKDLKAEIQRLPFQKVIPRDFLHFYSIAIYAGLLDVGFELRSRAKEAAICTMLNGDAETVFEEHHGLTALFEAGRYKDVETHLKKVDEISNKHRRLLQHQLNIYTPSKKSGKDVGFKKVDKEYYDYINGKSIAIVGPAKTDKKDAAEIENFDVIIRCNYKYEGVGVDHQIKGTRCDVTYFNKEQKQHLMNEDQVNWPTGIRWVVCKNQEDAREVYEKISLSINGSADSDPLFNYRSMINMNHVQFNGSLNSIPNIVLDLLPFRPKNVKIFHADLMLTVDRQKGYYPEEWNRDNKMEKDYLKSSSRAHDPVTQYNLLRNLWDKDLIEGDERFNMVMSLGDEEYMRQMQLIYGNAGRIIE